MIPLATLIGFHHFTFFFPGWLIGQKVKWWKPKHCYYLPTHIVLEAPGSTVATTGSPQDGKIYPECRLSIAANGSSAAGGGAWPASI